MCGIAKSKLPDGPMAGEVSLFQQALAERLHDGPLQELVALQLRAANLARLGAESAADREARIVELGNLAQAAIEHLQQIIRDLMGDASRPVALFVRLTDLCDQFRAGSGIDCRLLAVPAHVRFEPAVSEVIFRRIARAADERPQALAGDRREDHEPFPTGRSRLDQRRGQRHRAAVGYPAAQPVRGRRLRPVEHRAPARRVRRRARDRKRSRPTRDDRGPAQVARRAIDRAARSSGNRRVLRHAIRAGSCRAAAGPAAISRAPYVPARAKPG